jgi:hypothetical protein
MIRVKDNPMPVVCYHVRPDTAVLRYKGQHVRLAARPFGAVRDQLAQEAVAAIDILPAPGAPAVDVCLRDVIVNYLEETTSFRFDVLYASSNTKAREEAKRISGIIEEMFTTPSPETGALRTCSVRCLSVSMGGVFDPLSPGYYGYGGK